MRTIDAHEAIKDFSQLMDAAMAGEEIIIARDGIPCIKFAPILTAPRKPGALK